jgi:hypothetical protein
MLMTCVVLDHMKGEELRQRGLPPGVRCSLFRARIGALTRFRLNCRGWPDVTSSLAMSFGTIARSTASLRHRIG